MINQVAPVSDTRSRLVLTAMQLFWEKGYNSTSIADVLQTAKVNSGSLYYFFPGKVDLLVAVLDLYHDGIRSMLLEPAWTGVDDPIEKVFALLARYRQSLLDTDCRYRARSANRSEEHTSELQSPDLPLHRLLPANTNN